MLQTPQSQGAIMIGEIAKSDFLVGIGAKETPGSPHFAMDLTQKDKFPGYGCFAPQSQ